MGNHKMNPHDLQNQIAATSFLCGLGGGHVKLIAECAWRTQFDAGDAICRQGDTANRFYLIERGTVQLEAALHSGERRVVAGMIGSGGVLYCRAFERLGPRYEKTIYITSEDKRRLEDLLAEVSVFNPRAG